MSAPRPPAEAAGVGPLRPAPTAILAIFCPVCAAELAHGPEVWTCRDCARAWPVAEVRRRVQEVVSDIRAGMFGGTL